MRLALTESQEQFRTEVRSFTATIEPNPRHGTVEDQFRFLVNFQHRLNEAGLATVAWPAKYGGRGLSPVEYAIVCEELGRSQAPEVVNFVAIDVIAPALLEFCEDEQLTSWLPQMASARDIWCQLFSEPDAGSDLANLRTQAVRTSEGWLVNGQKVWSTWAHFSKWGLLLARTGSVEQRHRGITAFVISMSTPGIDVHMLKTMTGSAEFAEVFFDDVQLPESAVVGGVGNGWKVAQVMLTAERGPYAIRRAAVLRGALTGLQILSQNSKGKLQRQSVVNATIAMELLDLRIASVVSALCRNEDIGHWSALTKLLLGQVDQTIFSAAIDALGATSTAYEVDDPSLTEWVENYLYSRASTIYGGTAQIQKNILAERLLGLPR